MFYYGIRNVYVFFCICFVVVVVVFFLMYNIKYTKYILVQTVSGVILWGSFWAGRLLKKLNGKRQKRADFVRFATVDLSSQSAPANYDKMRLLGQHIACQYGVHINIACIISSLVCCCCYDLKFTVAECFKPTIEDIFHVFFFFFKKENEESMSPSQTKQ